MCRRTLPEERESSSQSCTLTVLLTALAGLGARSWASSDADAFLVRLLIGLHRCSAAPLQLIYLEEQRRG